MEVIIDNVVYESIPAWESYCCNNCVGDSDQSLCDAINNCDALGNTTDGCKFYPDIIWVKKGNK